MFGLHFGRADRGPVDFQVDVEALLQLVDEGVRFREKIARVDRHHRNVGNDFGNQVDHQRRLGSEARGHHQPIAERLGCPLHDRRRLGASPNRLFTASRSTLLAVIAFPNQIPGADSGGRNRTGHCKRSGGVNPRGSPADRQAPLLFKFCPCRASTKKEPGAGSGWLSSRHNPRELNHGSQGCDCLGAIALFRCLRKSQAKTLSDLVAAALSAQRMSLALPGQGVGGVESGAGQALRSSGPWRFIVNRHVEPVEVMPVLMNRLWRRRLKWHRKRPDRRPLLVSLDWTKVRMLLHAHGSGGGRGAGRFPCAGRATPTSWCTRARTPWSTRCCCGSSAALPAGSSRRDPGRPGVPAAPGAGGQSARDWALGAPGPHQRRRDRQGRGLRGLRGLAWQPQALPDPPGRVCRSMARWLEYRFDGVVTTNLIARWKKLAWSGTRISPGISSRGLTPANAAKRRAPPQRPLLSRRFDIEELFRDAKERAPGLGPEQDAD